MYYNLKERYISYSISIPETSNTLDQTFRAVRQHVTVNFGTQVAGGRSSDRRCHSGDVSEDSEEWKKYA